MGGLVCATFLGQVIDQVAQQIVFNRADQSGLLALLTDHSGRFQVCDVVRQGGAGNIQLLLNLAYGQTNVACSHQQAHDLQSGRITDFGENIGSVVEFHERDNRAEYNICQRYY